jgi:hypothetical protein
MRPANWDIAHWFTRASPTGGWQTACGRSVARLFRDHAGEVGYPAAGHPTCRKCAASLR